MTKQKKSSSIDCACSITRNLNKFNKKKEKQTNDEKQNTVLFFFFAISQHNAELQNVMPLTNVLQALNKSPYLALAVDIKSARSLSLLMSLGDLQAH